MKLSNCHLTAAAKQPPITILSRVLTYLLRLLLVAVRLHVDKVGSEEGPGVTQEAHGHLRRKYIRAAIV